MRNVVLLGDVREQLKSIPDNSVQTCVTSPPYWGLRDYGHGGQIGLEKSPAEYIQEMVNVFREVRRVLRDDGTLWLNLGDSYWSDTLARKDPVESMWGNRPASDLAGGRADIPTHNRRGGLGERPNGIKPKDLVGIPWEVAFALRNDGWYLRSDIIWAKNAVMPEPVRDRPTKAHEYIFLLTKSERYFYDDFAVKEPAVSEPHAPGNKNRTQPEFKGARDPALEPDRTWGGDGKRNRRTVWTINPRPYKGAHFATFPETLPEICIKAGTSEKGACPSCGSPWHRIVEHGAVVSEGGSDTGIRAANLESVSPLKQEMSSSINTGRMVQREHLTKGWEPTCSCEVRDPVPCIVLDPFSGSGTTLAVAKKLRRDYLGVELNPEYHQLIRERLAPAEELESGRLAFEAVMLLDE